MLREDTAAEADLAQRVEAGVRNVAEGRHGREDALGLTARLVGLQHVLDLLHLSAGEIEAHRVGGRNADGDGGTILCRGQLLAQRAEHQPGRGGVR